MDHNQLVQTMSDSTLLSYIDAHETLITTPDISIPEYDLETSISLIEQSSDQALVEYIELSN
jgi:hypothetical protein